MGVLTIKYEKMVDSHKKGKIDIGTTYLPILLPLPLGYWDYNPVQLAMGTLFVGCLDTCGTYCEFWHQSWIS